jgi:hypothetical protein
MSKTHNDFVIVKEGFTSFIYCRKNQQHLQRSLLWDSRIACRRGRYGQKKFAKRILAWLQQLGYLHNNAIEINASIHTLFTANKDFKDLKNSSVMQPSSHCVIWKCLWMFPIPYPCIFNGWVVKVTEQTHSCDLDFNPPNRMPLIIPSYQTCPPSWKTIVKLTKKPGPKFNKTHINLSLATFVRESASPLKQCPPFVHETAYAPKPCPSLVYESDCPP